MVLNSAFVFIKPHANTEAVQKLAKADLEAHGLTVKLEGELTGEVIDKDKLIDQHYYAIASKATILKPNELNIPKDKFKEKFGCDWDETLAAGKIFNAMDACEKLGLDADGLDKEWAKAKKADKLVKFGGGFYCGYLDTIEGKDPIYSFNGFFMSMRAKFTTGSIHYYVVEWDAAKLPWADFRGKVLGPTDPADAPKDSLRGKILADWEALGLKAEPNVGDNGMHASASPFEGFAERNNWLKVAIKDDAFGEALLNLDMTEDMIKAWCVDPQIKIGDDKKGSCFDQLEDMDCEACLAKIKELKALQ